MKQSDMIEILQAHPKMFGTLDMYLKTTESELKLVSESGYEMGSIILSEDYSSGQRRYRTKFQKTDLTNNGTWTIWKESKKAYPIRNVNIGDYLEGVVKNVENGESLFNAQRNAEEVLPGGQIDWRTYIYMGQKFWRSITDW